MYCNLQSERILTRRDSNNAGRRWGRRKYKVAWVEGLSIEIEEMQSYGI